jgi:hypothetical protein
MAKYSSSILELARKGATHKYQELKTEMASLLAHFPHLAGEAPPSTRRNFGRVRKRRKMSAAARAKISAAQKKRWAKQKAAGKK